MSDAFLVDTVDTTLDYYCLLYNICVVQWIARSVSQHK